MTTEQLSVKIQASRGMLRHTLMWSVLAALVFGPMAYLVLGRQESRRQAREELESPPLGWTTEGTHGYPVTVGDWPKQDPRQVRPPCRTAIGQEEIRGYCWLRLDIRPPCPPGEGATEYKRACYVPVLAAQPMPTTGDVLPVTVAGE